MQDILDIKIPSSDQANVIGYVKAYKGIMKNICYYCGRDAVAVYLMLLSHRNYKTGECFPSLSTLAKEVGASEVDVQRSIASLVSYKFIKYEMKEEKAYFSFLKQS